MKKLLVFAAVIAFAVFVLGVDNLFNLAVMAVGIIIFLRFGSRLLKRR